MKQLNIFLISILLTLIVPLPALCVEVEFEKLHSLTQEQIAQVRSEPSVKLPVAFVACEVELRRKLAKLRLTEQQVRIVFASVVAQAMAPYGPSKSTRLTELLSDKAMDCDNYAVLAGHLSRIILGRDIPLKIVGFDGGAVGNHAQVIAECDGNSLLLDPMVGLVAKISFNDLLSGKALDAGQFQIFRQHNDREIDLFARRISNALQKGSYRPSDLLYYFASVDDYVSFSDETRPLWSSNINALIQRYPTPAALALKNKLLRSGAQ